MKLRNKFLSILMVAAMTISAMSTVFAAGEPTIKLTGPTDAVKAGDTFTMTFDVVNNPGIIGMSAYVNYDKAAFTLTKATDAKVMASGVLNQAPTTGKLFWNDDTAEDNYIEDATYATLTFTVNANAKPGAYDFSLTTDDDNIINFDCETVAFATAGCTVTVAGNEPETVDNYFSASFTAGGQKYNANKGMTFNFFSKAANDSAKYTWNFTEMFGSTVFQTETDVDVQIMVEDAPAADDLTITGFEWSETGRE